MTQSTGGINWGLDEDIRKAVACLRADTYGQVAEEEPVSAPARKNREVRQPSWAMVIVIAVLVSILSSSASLVVYDRFFAQKIMTANISKFVLDQRELYFQGKIAKQQYLNNLNGFIALLKNQPRNRVVILEDVVAANAERLEPR